MIRHPLAGNMLAFFHYVFGLAELGHEVLYLEESGWPQSCYNPANDSYSDDPSCGIRSLQILMESFGVTFPIHYLNRSTGLGTGLPWSDVKSALRESDVLLNIGGVCWLDEFRLCRRRVLIDMDPFFTQIGKLGVGGLDDYHHYFSYGANIGSAGCTIPTNGAQWIPTVPPVITEIWGRNGHPPVMRTGGDAPLTTIANWTAYGEAVYEGEQYGQKDREFLRVLSLPGRVRAKLELALGGGDERTKERFRHAGWIVRNALDISVDVPKYQSYIACSLGEFSMVKHAYVKTRSGWFSDRSVCYLASGRPVILQDSGFTDWLRTDRGVVAFSSLEEAARCIEHVSADYQAHCYAARKIAETTFGYKRVLSRLLEIAMGQTGERMFS
jgi:hypothetical protein